MSEDGTEYKHEWHRLGKRELGRHAFERRMPAKVKAILGGEDQSNDLENVIPQLAVRLNRDKDVQVAYLCTSATVQVHKLPDEGPYFCGYRNLQMILLASGRAGLEISSPCDVDQDSLPQKIGIPRLQSLIESAWSNGHNAHARVQTGGIKDTRKYIGTSEVEALLLNMEIPCTATVFSGNQAWKTLLDTIEKYFITSASTDPSPKVHQTGKLPIFLQRPRHSMTVVGMEHTTRGKRRLLVFDPAWRPPKALTQNSRSSLGGDRWVLRRYRKSERYLRKFHGFEILWING